MITDAIAYAKRCHACQIHGDFIHQAPGTLHPTVKSWSFEMWGIDVIGPINPPTSKGHRFILAITEYFSKWAEAIPLKEVKAIDVIKFIKHHVMTMDHNLSASHFRDSAISSESRVCHQQHITLMPMV